MAENSSSGGGKPRKKIKIPILSYILSVITHISMVSIFAGFICILAEFALYMYEPELGHQPAYNRYKEIILNIDSNESTMFNEKVGIAHIHNWLDEVINVDSVTAGINSAKDLGSGNSGAVNNVSRLNMSVFKNIYKSILHHANTIFYLWYIVTFTWILKVITILSMIIPCVLILGVGFVDGCISRKINTFKGEIDSEDKHEFWYKGFMASNYIAIFLYIAIPNGLTAYFFVIPNAMISAFFLRMTVKHYKKYF